MVRCPKCEREYDSEKRFCAIDGTRLKKMEPLSVVKEEPSSFVIGGRYRVISKLGEGGMGSVFLASHELLDAHVAVKLLHPALAHDTELIRRFVLEARATSRIAHPNIIATHDFGYDHGHGYFLVMELVEGQTLEKLIGKHVTQTRAIHLLRQVFSALAVAHDAGVIHRDLKPANIALTAKLGNPEHVKILDFGVAKILVDSGLDAPLTRAGTVLGTPEYMAPEQAIGRDIDGRTDLYAIGILAYELLTGEVPFRGPVREILRQQVSEIPARPSEAFPELEVHEDLEELVLRLLAKDPRRRVQNARAAMTVLDRVRADLLSKVETETSVLAGTRGAIGASITANALGFAGTTAKVLPALGESWSKVSAASALLEEIRRLEALWSRRLHEVALLAWNEEGSPAAVEDSLREVTKLERGIDKREVEIAVVKDEIEKTAETHASAEEELRLVRLDHVGRLGELCQMILELESTDTSARSATDSSYEGLENASDLENRAIDEIDIQRRANVVARDEATRSLESRLLTLLREVNTLQQQLEPLYTTISGAVHAAAKAKPELRDHVVALTEVAGAIQLYQSRVKLD